MSEPSRFSLASIRGRVSGRRSGSSQSRESNSPHVSALQGKLLNVIAESAPQLSELLGAVKIPGLTSKRVIRLLQSVVVSRTDKQLGLMLSEAEKAILVILEWIWAAQQEPVYKVNQIMNPSPIPTASENGAPSNSEEMTAPS